MQKSRRKEQVLLLFELVVVEACRMSEPGVVKRDVAEARVRAATQAQEKGVGAIQVDE